VNGRIGLASAVSMNSDLRGRRNRYASILLEGCDEQKVLGGGRPGHDHRLPPQRKSGTCSIEKSKKQAIAGFAMPMPPSTGDIDAAVASLDPNIEWTEPAEFFGGGSYHGIQGVKRYLTQSHAGAAR
jgi:hypothetical protein